MTPSGRRIAAAASTLLAVAAVSLGGWWLAGGRGDQSAARFTRGPFLTHLSEHDAVLRWRLDHPGTVVVRATAPGEPTVRAFAGRVGGLRAGTRYSWTASISNGEIAYGSFTTAPRTLRAPLRFAVIGDYGSGNAHE